MSHTLEVDSVILEFGTKRVLQDVYLKSETGKITGLLGRNGSGKTSLMKIIYGELSATNMSVRIDGKNSIYGFHSPETIRYLPQVNFIPGSLSINRVFQDFRLDFQDFINDFPEFKKYCRTSLRKLSGGERRIVEIYAILVSKAKFCMLDEPFTHILPLHVDTIKRLIEREKKTKGILITDHLYKHIIDICDDLYVISNGKTWLVDGIQDLERLGYTKTDTL